MTDQITYIDSFLTNHELTRNLQYGVMLRMAHEGRSYAHLDDTTNFTKAQALDEAMAHETNDLLGLFSIDMATGEMQQIMNRSDLIDYCEERERSEMSEGEKAEQREIDRHNFITGSTL